MSTLFAHFFHKINQISPLECDFTSVLESIALKPKILYFYGKMPENVVDIDRKGVSGLPRRPKSVAIVGSRHNTRYGEEIAYKLSYELARRGVVVVSGLAYGIDSIAHRAALDASGKTVAVLGTPIDEIYPRTHEGLAREIIEKDGAVMSEYAPGAKVFMKTSFLERNRLIAGLADVVIIVEAAAQSGTLNTAMHALDQGKDVFAVPGNITSPLSEGCNRLIRHGAIPCLSVEDVYEVLFPGKKLRHKVKQPVLFGDTEEETMILKCLSDGMRDGDQIMAEKKLSPSLFGQTISLMEIKGLVKSLGANKWVLK